MWSAIRPIAARATRHASQVAPLARISLVVARPKIAPTARPAAQLLGSQRRGLASDDSPKPRKTKTATKKQPAAEKAKAKPRKTKKKVVAKKKPAKRVRRELTPEEKTKLLVRELKKVALLNKPDQLPDRVWTVYVSQNVKGTKLSAGGIGPVTSALSQTFRDISSLERQQLQATAEQNKLANIAAYKAWVESHTLEDITQANNARNRLRRLLNKPYSRIDDERQPKRPITSYALFCKSRWASGDFAGTQVTQAAKTLAAEWKDLSTYERQTFEEQAKSDTDRYEKEVGQSLGRGIRRSSSPGP